MLTPEREAEIAGLLEELGNAFWEQRAEIDRLRGRYPHDTCSAAIERDRLGNDADRLAGALRGMLEMHDDDCSFCDSGREALRLHDEAKP